MDMTMGSEGDIDTYILCKEPCNASGTNQKEIIDWNSGLCWDTFQISSIRVVGSVEPKNAVSQFPGWCLCVPGGRCQWVPISYGCQLAASVRALRPARGITRTPERIQDAKRPMVKTSLSASPRRSLVHNYTF